ncbi:hypothetical protein N7481_013072 [Penicillium waksmanii]|uniref:uncharacterized protein n=1 Tax=Penicillium waksmanii TaxID=69791 RepID=UPI002548399E|nr:uncharacterized protein N7481_013072 [Penicillium waksmanii]KAJ5966358.1 hypothetical protein N7481_013072 [Penicillium waksmanii]
MSERGGPKPPPTLPCRCSSESNTCYPIDLVHGLTLLTLLPDAVGRSLRVPVASSRVGGAGRLSFQSKKKHLPTTRCFWRRDLPVEEEEPDCRRTPVEPELQLKGSRK